MRQPLSLAGEPWVSVVDELTAAGVEMARYDQFEHDATGITPRAGRGRIAWFRDADGNTSPSKPTSEDDYGNHHRRTLVW